MWRCAYSDTHCFQDKVIDIVALFFLSFCLWPLLFGSALAITAYGFAADRTILAFNVAYFSLMAALAVLERLMPHEKEWQDADGQTFANIAHTLMSKGRGTGAFGLWRRDRHHITDYPAGHAGIRDLAAGLAVLVAGCPGAGGRRIYALLVAPAGP